MIIDIFKTGLFEGLKQHNHGIIDAFESISIKRGDYWYYKNDPDLEIHDWFNPYRIYNIPLPLNDPHILPINRHSKWVLPENYSNYCALFVINELYKNEPNVVIEDVCCGPAKLAYYLSKLGFHKFSLVDNFSQIRPEMLFSIMNAGKVHFDLNRPVEEIKPSVFIQIAYPRVVRPIHETVDLVCVYPLIEFSFGMENRGYKHLCRDADNTLIVYAHERRWQEFHDQLQPYSIG